MAKIKSVCASNWNDLGLRVVINSSLKFKINHNYASTPRTGRVSTLLAYKRKIGTFITPKQYTHCFLVAHWSCWTCKSLWRSTLSPCYPVRNSAAGLSPAPQWAPWCCYKVPEPETVLDLDLLFEADWSFGVYWESVPGRPPLSFSLCVWCPLWCKWIARKSLSHSLRGGKTQVLCPDSYFNLRSLTAEALSSNIRRRRRKKYPFLSFHWSREWVLFLEESHFLECYVIFAKCAFPWERIRAIVQKGLDSSTKLLITLFIPPCLIQAPLPLSFLCSLQGPDLCTAV